MPSARCGSRSGARLNASVRRCNRPVRFSTSARVRARRACRLRHLPPPSPPWIAIDELLSALAATAARLGARARTVTASWPEAVGEVGAADVVTCHHVLYNVPDLEPFVAALTRRARRRVVVEVTARHPLAALNPLWERLHGLRRPEGPTAADVLAILTAIGLDVTATAWTRPATAEFASFAELVEVTRRRLCLPPGRAGELEAALRELGSRPGCHPLQLGAPGRELVTMWWAGTAEAPGQLT